MAGARRSHRPTQADVARLARVSPAVVSAVINGQHDGGAVRASAQTAQRVMDAVRQLGYAPNVAARSLAGGRNNIIGVFTYEAVFPTNRLNFYHEFLTGIEEATERLDANLLLFTGSHGPGRRRTIYKNGVNSLQAADGAILLGQDEDRQELAALVASGFPAVYIGRRELPAGELSYVNADYAGATTRLVHRCAELGHRRLAMLRGNDDAEAVLARQSGFFAACQDNPAVESGAVHRVGADGPSPELLRTLRDQGVTCVVTDDASHAESVGEQAADAGLRVPDDLSVASLGDYAGNRPADESITSLLVPRREMGAAAVALLAELLADPRDTTPRHTTLACGLREGRTLAPPR
jgi:DNA-binding LacI/PurR family transcriptional regulator